MSLILSAMLAAFLTGLGGSAHCALMCGGISSVMVSKSAGRYAALQVLAAQLGRISSYMLAGVIAAGISTSILSILTTEVTRTVVPVLLGVAWITIALQLLGYRAQGKYVTRIGQEFWKHLQPLSKRIWPIDSTLRAFMAGTIWGWLPCGMSYSVLLVAAASADLGQAALLMGAFGLGTVPTLLIPAWAATKLQRLSLSLRVKAILAVLMIAFGAFLLVSPWLASTAHHHHL